MSSASLSLIPTEEPKSVSVLRFQFLSSAPSDAKISKVFIYSQGGFAQGAGAYETSRAYRPTRPAMPLQYVEIDLAGSFTPDQIKAALRAREILEDAAITALRARLVEITEESKTFDFAVRTIEAAERSGFLIDDCVAGVMVKTFE